MVYTVADSHTEPLSPAELRDLIVASLDELKGRSILALDVTKLTDVTDYMVLASGTSVRHIRALVDHLRDTAKQCAVHILGVEGQETGKWVLVDLGDVVVHVMEDETRTFYDLERLWSDIGATRTEAETSGATGPVVGVAGPEAARRKRRVPACSGSETPGRLWGARMKT